MKRLSFFLALGILPCACSSIPITTYNEFVITPEEISLGEQWATATHEAAHYVALVVQMPDFRVYDVNITTAVRTEKDNLGEVSYLEATVPTTPEGRLAAATAMFAGSEAEKILLGRKPEGCGDDYQLAEKLCQLRCLEDPNGACSGGFLGYLSTYRQVGLCLNESRTAAENLVRTHAQTIRDVASLIMRQPIRNHRRSIDGMDLKDFLLKRGVISKTPAPAGH